jgi:hypothetical protein
MEWADRLVISAQRGTGTLKLLKDEDIIGGRFGRRLFLNRIFYLGNFGKNSLKKM